VRGEYDVSAVFLWNDIIAVQVLEAVTGAGLGTRYSIVGFDDLPIASLATPRLSTVHVDREAIGTGAIRLLRQQMEGDRSVHQLEIGVRMVQGETIHPL
jgi:DNA-binding LacI/PurR family transcriptional regulator